MSNFESSSSFLDSGHNFFQVLLLLRSLNMPSNTLPPDKPLFLSKIKVYLIKAL